MPLLRISLQISHLLATYREKMAVQWLKAHPGAKFPHFIYIWLPHATSARAQPRQTASGKALSLRLPGLIGGNGGMRFNIAGRI